jgi:hypothetical protein
LLDDVIDGVLVERTAGPSHGFERRRGRWRLTPDGN